MKAIAIALLLATGCKPQPLSEADRVAIRSVLEQQRDAWNAGDVERFMDGYEQSPSIVFTSGGEIRRGYDETLQRYKAKYADDEAMGHLEFTDIEVRPLGSESAVVLGRWALTETPQAGHGVFSLVFVRTDGAWRIVHDHTSAGPAD